MLRPHEILGEASEVTGRAPCGLLSQLREKQRARSRRARAGNHADGRTHGWTGSERGTGTAGTQVSLDSPDDSVPAGVSK